jgi:diguanylate cyclase (GGDEF)-like protein
MKGKSTSYLCLLFALLVPVALTLVWSINGMAASETSAGLLAILIWSVLTASHVRIQLPRTNLFLSISDVFIIYALLSFGGEVAILLTVVAEGYAAFRRWVEEGQISILNILANTSVSIVTTFTTISAVTYVLGFSAPLENLGNGTLLLLVLLVTIVPFVVNSVLTSAFLAINTQTRFWVVWRVHGLDALLVYFCVALMGGLLTLAVRESNIFLLVALGGVLALLHTAFRRYTEVQRKSEANAEWSEFERAELAEKHVAELKGYVVKIEQTAKELKESREKYRYAAFHDQLTGLPNRNYFADAVERQLGKTRLNRKYRFSFMILDIQNFRTINESLGRAAGDELIKNIGDRLISLIKQYDVVGRIGGDEFALLLQDVKRDDDVVAFAQNLLKSLAEPFDLDGRYLFARGTLGIAIGNADCKSAEDVLRDAEMAMHRAKERGRGYVMFDKQMLARAVSHLQLETDLRLAVERDEFEMFYQPIVDLPSSRIHGFEALMRWNHPTLGLIPPEKFIPISEATGLIIPMTLRALEVACTQLVNWNKHQDVTRPLFASVNLSGTHFGQPGLVDQIKCVLSKTGLNPRCLKLEITETVVMENADNAISMLRQIKDLGVQISLDDFGTGYSSLSYLQRFPIDAVKIDRAFVRSMEEGRQNGEIVRAIIALADAMKLSVIAEGIESVHQLHQLTVLSCQYGQGYLFSPPLPGWEFEGLLEDQSRWQNLLAGGSFEILAPLVEIREASLIN